MAHATDRYVHTHTLNFKAAVYAGLLAGVVFMVFQMILTWGLLGQSPWGPPRMIAAIVLGRGVLPPPAGFDAGVMITAMIVHFVLAIVYASVLGIFVDRMRRPAAILAGGAFGIVLYFINFVPLANLLFPWFAEARGWMTLLNHALFGAVLGWVYVAFNRNDGSTRRTSISMP